MKRWIATLVGILLLFGLTACAAPGETHDLTYDMANYEFFPEIFEEKALDEWAAMGRYTMLLKGLHTPVVVGMDGTDVLTIGAHGQTVELGAAGLADGYHDGLSPVCYIGSTRDAVVIRVSCGEAADDSILITEDRCFTFEQETDHSTNFYVREDGTLEYRRTWNAGTNFEQMGFYALEACTDRNAPLYETGSAEIVEGDLALTAEETVVLSDIYDLDALFAEAKAAGEFAQFDSLDALLAANQSGED